MYDDPIVAEVRRIREAHAARFGHNLEAIVRDIQERERKSGRTYVSLPPRRISPAEQEAARIRLQELLEEEARASDTAPQAESPDSRLAG
jgi:hypothetical protein